MRAIKAQDVVGKPGLQGNVLEKLCNKWQVKYYGYYVSPGTLYYELSAPSGRTLKVRLAKEPDHYQTADISWDIQTGDEAWNRLKQWVQINGLQPMRWGAKIAASIARKLRQALPLYTVEILEGDDPEIVIANAQQQVLVWIGRRGVHLAVECPSDLRETLKTVVPADRVELGVR